MKDTPTMRWVRTPAWLLTAVSGTDLLVYCVLASHASRSGRVRVQQDTLAEECRVTERTVRRSLTRLREVGAVTWDERQFRQGANEYRVHLDRSPVTGPDRTPPSPRPDTNDRADRTQVTAPEVPTGLELDELQDGAARYARSPEPEASVTTIDGGLFPEPERREPTPAELANECRRVWHETYAVHHGPPDPSLKRQAMGRIGQLAKDRTDVETWRALWQACHDAGAAGVWQVAQYLGPPPTPRYTQPRNAGLALLMEMRRPAETGPPWLNGPPPLPLNSSPASQGWTHG